MANELVMNLPSVSFTKGALSVKVLPGQQSLTVTGTHFIHDVAVLSTSDATMPKGSIGTIGFVYAKNLDTTNNVLIGSDGTLFPLSLKPGEWAVYRWNAAAFHAKSSAGAPNFEFLLIED